MTDKEQELNHDEAAGQTKIFTIRGSKNSKIYENDEDVHGKAVVEINYDANGQVESWGFRKKDRYTILAEIINTLKNNGIEVSDKNLIEPEAILNLKSLKSNKYKIKEENGIRTDRVPHGTLHVIIADLNMKPHEENEIKPNNERNIVVQITYKPRSNNPYYAKPYQELARGIFKFKEGEFCSVSFTHSNNELIKGMIKQMPSYERKCFEKEDNFERRIVPDKWISKTLNGVGILHIGETKMGKEKSMDTGEKSH